MKKKLEGTHAKVVGYIPLANRVETTYKQKATVVKITGNTIPQREENSEKRGFSGSLALFIVFAVILVICMITIKLAAVLWSK